MARKKKRETDGGGASWMETYSDMVTLLLTFFIMLYAMSTIDAQKYATIVASFSKQLNPEVYYQQQSSSTDTQGVDSELAPTETEELDDIDKLYNLLYQYVNENHLSDQVEVSKSKEYVFIRFSDAISFRGYSDILEQQGKEILDVLAEGLTLVDEYIEEVIIAGHTAEVKNENSDIDRTLSTDRANVVLRYLEDKNAIDPAKYLAIGYGLYSPLADNSTAEGRAKNRRVEIYISRAGYPISYTNKIQESINNSNKKEIKEKDENNKKNVDTTDNNIEYKKNTYIN
ncbi:MAG: flagellar motor protein MotB [Tissierellia bacterium]|nr:flagellar motor protein MotB [Tissierellia bacterium]